MAKSLRCKRRVKMRNMKREMYSKKLLDQLKKTVETGNENGDTEMKEIYHVKKASEVVQQSRDKSQDGDMEHDGNEFNPKTLRNKDGHYPAYMNQRAIKKLKKKQKDKEKAKKKAKVKKGSKKGGKK